MIGVSSSSRSFKSLGRYLVLGRTGDEQGRVAWSTARNLPTDDPELAAKIMRATAAQNVRTEQPVYHLALSFDPHDAVDRAKMERVAQRVINELGLREHQVLIVAHGDRKHSHMHILVNRVHPKTGKAWDRWQDYSIVQRVLREEEETLGLRAVRGPLHASRETNALEKPQGVESGEKQREPMRTHSHGRENDVESIQRDLDAHERVTALSRERYAVEMEVASLQARASQLERAIRRVQSADASFMQSLGAKYMQPAEAKLAFLEAVGKTTPIEAVRHLRDRPQAFGRLHIATEPAIRECTESSRDAFAIAARGGEFLTARAHLEGLLRREVQALGGVGLDCKGVDAIVAAHTDKLRETRESLRSTIARDHGTSLREIEYRLTQELRRMSPPEFARLSLTLSGHRLSIANKLRAVAKDVVLGREN